VSSRTSINFGATDDDPAKPISAVYRLLSGRAVGHAVGRSAFDDEAQGWATR
jgi:hypothetical protein